VVCMSSTQNEDNKSITKAVESDLLDRRDFFLSEEDFNAFEEILNALPQDLAKLETLLNEKATCGKFFMYSNNCKIYYNRLCILCTALIGCLVQLIIPFKNTQTCLSRFFNSYLQTLIRVIGSNKA